MIQCKICQKEFATEGGLHKHLKSHSITMAEYYTTFYPRESLLHKTPLPFKNKQDYFDKDFHNYEELLQWCRQERSDVVGEYIVKKLKQRINSKELKYAPSHLELRNAQLPPIDVYKNIFGSYSVACDMAGVKPMFNKAINKTFFQVDDVPDDLTIFIDTREKEPLSFENSTSMKLDFGDYTTAGEHYNYTYVDRKSEGDFKSTLSNANFERFRAELCRTRDFDSYLYVVVESSIEKIEKDNKYKPYKVNLKYIFHNMRLLQHEFSGNCQFIFTGSREKSEALIPKLLYHGKKLWDVDLQYYIDKHGISSPQKKTACNL